MSKITEFWDRSGLIHYACNPKEEYEAYLRAEFPSKEGEESQWYPHKPNLITLEDFEDYICELCEEEISDLEDQREEIQDDINNLNYKIENIKTFYNQGEYS